MPKLLMYVLCSMFVSLSLAAVAFGQSAVEYGILGSKPPPKSTGAGKSVGEKIQGALKQTPPRGQGSTTQTVPQSQPGGKTGGPLIIEQRGNHYERVH